jgi:hypothetical protein
LDIILLSNPEKILTEPQKETLIGEIAQKLNQEIQADVSITPVYTATPLDRLLPTLEEKTFTAINTFTQESYPLVTLLNSEISPNRSALLLDMRSSESFDTVRFRTKLSDYLLDQ